MSDYDDDSDYGDDGLEEEAAYDAETAGEERAPGANGFACALALALLVFLRFGR
jgi:hypothetical protein